MANNSNSTRGIPNSIYDDDDEEEINNNSSLMGQPNNNWDSNSNINNNEAENIEEVPLQLRGGRRTRRNRKRKYRGGAAVPAHLIPVKLTAAQEQLRIARNIPLPPKANFAPAASPSVYSFASPSVYSSASPSVSPSYMKPMSAMGPANPPVFPQKGGKKRYARMRGGAPPPAMAPFSARPMASPMGMYGSSNMYRPPPMAAPMGMYSSPNMYRPPPMAAPMGMYSSPSMYRPSPIASSIGQIISQLPPSAQQQLAQMPPASQQQALQYFNSLPPSGQQQMLRQMGVPAPAPPITPQVGQAAQAALTAQSQGMPSMQKAMLPTVAPPPLMGPTMKPVMTPQMTGQMPSPQATQTLSVMQNLARASAPAANPPSGMYGPPGGMYGMSNMYGPPGGMYRPPPAPPGGMYGMSNMYMPPPGPQSGMTYQSWQASQGIKPSSGPMKGGRRGKGRKSRKSKARKQTRKSRKLKR